MIVSMPAPTTRCSSLELGCSCFALMPTSAGSSTDLLETCSCLAMARTGIEGRIVEPTKPGVRSAARLNTPNPSMAKPGARSAARLNTPKSMVTRR